MPRLLKPEAKGAPADVGAGLREVWLASATRELNATFFPVLGEHAVPEKLQCSCGWTRGGKNVIGQCFSPVHSADGTTHLFICPTQDEPVRVLDILLHEMIHAAVGVDQKHGGLFRKAALEVGLSGKMTATIAEAGTELHSTLTKIVKVLGPYPHRAMIKTIGKDKEKKPSNGWVRYFSSNDEDYKVMVSPKKVEEFGPPMDWLGDVMSPVE